MIHIGIDPGASGGIAWVNDQGTAYNAAKMPETERELLDLFETILKAEQRYIEQHDEVVFERPVARAVIERVWSSPQMGVASAFKFGANVGRLHMALVAARVPFDESTPQKWQKVMGCQVGKSRASGGPAGGDKNITKRRAQALFPAMKVTHAIADALLIAEFCRRMHGAQGMTPTAPAKGLFDGEESEGRKGGEEEGRAEEEGRSREGAAQAAPGRAAGDGRSRHRRDRARRA